MMMQRYYAFWVLLFIFSFTFFAGVQSLRAESTAKDIEIPVRVYADGKPVNTPGSSRCFVLVFKIVEFNEQLKQSLECFFDNILKEQDRLMILFNTDTLLFKNIVDIAKSHSIVERAIRRQCELMTKSQKTDLKKTGEFISKLRRDFERNVSSKISSVGETRIYQHYYMVYFRSYLRRYLDILLDYNKRYLIPDLDRWHLFAGEIKNSEKEKQVIYFHQVSRLPRLSKRNRMMIKKMIDDLANSESSNPDDEYDYEKKISRLLGSIDEALSVTAVFPTEEISILFDKINASFSSIRIDNGTELEEDMVKDTRFQPTSERIEKELTQIASRTGGSVIDLRPAAKADQVHHRIHSGLKKSSNPIHRLHDDANVRTGNNDEYIEKKSGEIKKVRLKNVTIKQKTLSFEIVNFVMKESKGQRAGKLHVHIRIEDKNNKIIFDENKTLVSKKDTVNIALGLKIRKKEKYDITIAIRDLISAETYIEYSRH